MTLRLHSFERWNLRVNFWAMLPVWSQASRAQWLRRFGMRVGEGTLIQSCVIGSRNVSIGDWSYIGPDCHLDGTVDIRIGNRVALAHRVLIVTSSHRHDDPRLRAGVSDNAAVVIGDGAWIGAGAIVLPGVEIGEGCVIGAGSLVTRSCEPHGLYVGSPARRIRDLPT